MATSDITAKVKPIQAHCATHGSYNARVVQIGMSAHTSPCPKCDAAKEKARENERNLEREKARKTYINRLLQGSGIPKRYQRRTFSNYRTNDPQAREAYENIVGYAEHFETGPLLYGAGLVLYGKTGTGKTHLACALLQRVIRKFGRRARYTTAYDLAQSVKETYRPDARVTEDTRIAEWAGLDLLVIDEVGMGRGSEAEQLILWQVIDKRRLADKPTVIVSNLGEDELPKALGRALPRITEGGGAMVGFNWESYRDRVADDDQLPTADVEPVQWPETVSEAEQVKL